MFSGEDPPAINSMVIPGQAKKSMCHELRGTMAMKWVKDRVHLIAYNEAMLGQVWESLPV